MVRKLIETPAQPPPAPGGIDHYVRFGETLMVRSWLFRMAGVLGLATLAVGPAQAQVFTPTFMSPRLTNDLGIYISDFGDLGIEGIWRGGPLGLRVGLIDAGDDLLSVGGEFRHPIALVGAPLSLAFTAGAQGLIGDADAFGFQGGLTAGYTFLTPGMAFTPYIHPRIAFVDGFAEEDDFETEVLAEVGADFEFSPRIILRFGANLSDVGADWGIGLAWRR